MVFGRDKLDFHDEDDDVDYYYDENDAIFNEV